MKSILAVVVLMLTSTVSLASADKCKAYGPRNSTSNNSEIKHFFGEQVTDVDQEQLKKHQGVFCETAPGLVAKAYGQVVFDQGACECGRPQLNIKDGQRYLVIKNVTSYFGNRDLALVTSLTSKDGKDIFGGVRTIGLDGE